MDDVTGVVLSDLLVTIVFQLPVSSQARSRKRYEIPRLVFVAVVKIKSNTAELSPTRGVPTCHASEHNNLKFAETRRKCRA
jgi:hypothetical protein